MTLVNFRNVKAICITNGAWTNIGSAIQVMRNIVLAIAFKLNNTKVFRGSAKSTPDEEW